LSVNNNDDVQQGQNGLTAFEKGVLRRVFGPKRDGVTEHCRKLHS